jgi:molecular chaperone GrpE (heat shock protein)
MSQSDDHIKDEARNSPGGAAAEVAGTGLNTDKLLELMEELAEDNAALSGMFNRMHESQMATRDQLVREIDSLRQDLAGAVAYRALKDLCCELSTPLGALQSMLQDGDFSDPAIVQRHVSGLVVTIRSVLLRMGAEEIAVSPGEDLFNPERHFCIRVVAPQESPYPSAPPRTVVRVVENGYFLGGRLLSPARVEVQAEGKGAPPST